MLRWYCVFNFKKHIYCEVRSWSYSKHCFLKAVNIFFYLKELGFKLRC